MEIRLPDLPDSLYRAALEQSPDWLWIFDASETPFCISPAPYAGSSLYSLAHDDDLERLRASCEQLLRERVPFRISFRVILKDGTFLWLEGQGYSFIGPDGQNRAALSGKDFTHYKLQEDRLTRLAYYDPLTGLPNRRLFQDRITQSLHFAKRYHHNLAVIYLDLDDFKSVNDRYGHAVGDELLVKIASRLSHSVREPDTVCRMGGDEFVLLLQQFAERDDIVKISRRIADALNQTFDLCGQKITMACSIGAALFPEHGESVETLLQNADTAMYASKSLGKNHFKFYNDSY